MRLKGLSEVIKKIEAMKEDVNDKIDQINWDAKNADERDEKLNAAWDELEAAKAALESIKEI